MDEELKEELSPIEELKAKATPEGIGKMIVRGVARYGTAFVAASIAKTYVPTENKKQELQVAVGAFVIGGMAGDAAADWAERQFNEYLNFAKGVVKSVQHAINKENTSEETPVLAVVSAE